jgi:tetratricopeptide (TPR) repeat protein
MTGQLSPKTTELINEINTYFSKYRKPSDWQIKLLKKKIDHLKGKISDSLYYGLLGNIAALEDDIPALRQYFQTAIKINPTSSQPQFQYLVALKNRGRCSEELVLCQAMLIQFPDHSDEINFWMAESAFMSCRMNEAKQYLEHIKNKDQSNSLYHHITEGQLLFKTAGLSDEIASHLYNLAYDLVQQFGLYFSSTGVVVTTRGYVHCQLYVDLPIDNIYELNYQLAAELVHNTENTYSDILLFEFNSIDVFEERAES